LSLSSADPEVLTPTGKVRLDIDNSNEFNLFQRISTTFENDSEAVDGAAGPPAVSSSPGRERSGTTLDTNLNVPARGILDGAVTALVGSVDGRQSDRSF
jgi:hypothetical protein